MVILIVGTDLRWEAPLVNTRIRKAIKNVAKVYGIGPEIDLTYKVEWLGNDAGILSNVPAGLNDAFKNAQRPAMILGGGALAVAGVQGAALCLAQATGTLKEGWNGFTGINFSAQRMGGCMLCYAMEGALSDQAAAKPKRP